MVVGTYFISKPLQALDVQFMDYNSICCYLIAAGVFVLVKSINWSFLDKPVLSKIVLNIAGVCFGIYLVQMTVFYYVEKWLPMKPVVMMTAWMLTCVYHLFVNSSGSKKNTGTAEDISLIV